MNKKLKVITVVGTRPEIIRLSLIIRKLDTSPSIDHILIHTGQNYDYELNEIFFQDLNVRKPDYFLEAAGKNASETIGLVIIKIDKILEIINPDALLILGDTNSSLCAIPAKKRHIPIFHMEAGNRCYDQRVPEEINRKIIDHISDINLPYSSIARESLLREGLPADRIIKTGSPMFEVLHQFKKNYETSSVLEKMKLKKGEYFLVSAHREENIDSEKNFASLIELLKELSRIYNNPVIVSTHPRTRKKIEQNKIKLDHNIILSKPFGFFDYIALQLNAKAVLSDSGTISEESSILGFKALNIREAHERPEAMEETSVIMTGMNKERVLQGLMQLEQEDQKSFRIVNDYNVPNVSDKIVRIILSYTDYVKRVVWSENLS